MARIDVEIEETTLWSDDSGKEVPGVEATCDRCDHKTESFGTSSASRRRCLVLMREECPLNQENFYVDTEE